MKVEATYEFHNKEDFEFEIINLLDNWEMRKKLNIQSNSLDCTKYNFSEKTMHIQHNIDSIKWRKFLKKTLLLMFLFLIVYIKALTQQFYLVKVTTNVIPPADADISKYLSSANVIVNFDAEDNGPIVAFGKIECLSPVPFTIMLDSTSGTKPIYLTPGINILSADDKNNAFGYFTDNNLIPIGIDLAEIRDARNNIILPDGNYRICFSAKYQDNQGNASNPELGCAYFSICSHSGAPQFTQPISNFDINAPIGIVKPASPVVFTWTPPLSTCGLPSGGFTYDLEIWEILDNQTVTDAVNNPFVFRKTALPSSTFLLDTNLYKNVLQEGKNYAVRVRAINRNTSLPVVIENDGYSRVEGFQYGSSPGYLIAQNSVIDPQSLYIPEEERKSSYWDDVLTAYQAHKRKDTLVPIEEYIALSLTQTGIAYNTDAIELFMALNPELKGLKKIDLSYRPNLPEFPTITESDQSKSNIEHAINLQPDKAEKNKFLLYLDSLNNYKQNIPEKAVGMIAGITRRLNNFKTAVDTVNRVSVNLINQVLAELLYELRLYSKGINTSENQLQSLISTLQDLTELSPISTALLYPTPVELYPSYNNKIFSLSAYNTSSAASYIKQASFVNYTTVVNEIEYPAYFASSMDQLLPLNIIVWRNSKEQSYRPVLDAPDLKATYRIFYTLPGLYSHKSPEINATPVSRLASTASVSLPANSVFTFWTLNMLNHKQTGPKDVDVKDVFLNSMKRWPNPKKLSIVIKVD